jgi:hypothetical protein
MHQLLRILLVQIINYHTGEFLILHFFNVALRSLWVFFLLTLAAALIGFFIFAIKILMRFLILDLRVRPLLLNPWVPGLIQKIFWLILRMRSEMGLDWFLSDGHWLAVVGLGPLDVFEEFSEDLPQMVDDFLLVLDENLSLVWGNVDVIVIILYVQVQDEDRVHGGVVLLVHVRE